MHGGYCCLNAQRTPKERVKWMRRTGRAGERCVCARQTEGKRGGETAASQHRGSLQEMVAELSLTDTPFRGDSSVEVLLACRAALVNHCHSRHVLSASQPV